MLLPPEVINCTYLLESVANSGHKKLLPLRPLLYALSDMSRGNNFMRKGGFMPLILESIDIVQLSNIKQFLNSNNSFSFCNLARI